MTSSEYQAQKSAPATSATAIARPIAAFLMASARQRLQHGAQPLRLAAHGTSRPAGVVPRIDVEVRPREILGDEVVEEERGHDRSRESAAPAVVDVGDVAVEEPAVAAPERHAPHRVVDRLGCGEQLPGEPL